MSFLIFFFHFDFFFSIYFDKLPTMTSGFCQYCRFELSATTKSLACIIVLQMNTFSSLFSIFSLSQLCSGIQEMNVIDGTSSIRFGYDHLSMCNYMSGSEKKINQNQSAHDDDGGGSDYDYKVWKRINHSRAHQPIYSTKFIAGKTIFISILFILSFGDFFRGKFEFQLKEYQK